MNRISIALGTLSLLFTQGCQSRAEWKDALVCENASAVLSAPPQSLAGKITPTCRRALQQYGVLQLKDGTPAGRALMHKPVLKIALVENEFPLEFLTDDLKAYNEKQRVLSEPAALPPKIKESVIEGIRFWYKGRVEFVDLRHEKPDITIVATARIPSGGRAFASYPLNEGQNKEFGFENPFIALTPTESKETRPLSTVLRHEFGHTFGVDHSLAAYFNIPSDQVGYKCASEDASIILDLAQRPDFENAQIMSRGGYANSPGALDILMRDFIDGKETDFSCQPP